MKAQCIVAVLFVLVLCVLAQHDVPLTSRIERLALLDLRKSLGIRARDWPLKAEPCAFWIGIKCENGRVVGMNVSRLRRTRAGRLRPRLAVDSLGNFTRLVSFNASGFSLPGSIPDWFGRRLTALEVLDLSSCSISGPIPASLGDLNQLSSLYLSNNELTGNIPSTLGQLKVSILDLSRNSLTGSVPDAIGALGNLTVLDLSSNFLSGSIPPVLGKVPRLQLLNLSDNSLTDSIPGHVGNLTQLTELDLSKNSLSGLLPSGLISNLSRLEVVNLSGNKLDGALPRTLWSMPKLRFFDVSGNSLTGLLPSSGSDGKTAGASFNLSNNQLFGTLNFRFGKFRLVDLSGNYFKGKVPNDSRGNVRLNQNCVQDKPNQRSLEDCSLFYSQRGLKFDDFGKPETTHPLSADSDQNRKKLILILVGVIGGVVFAVLSILMLIMLLKICNKGNANQIGSSNVGPVPDGNRPSRTKDPIFYTGPGEPYTYEQILQFTNNLSEDNLIKHGHSGDLFRGFLERGIPVVVKRSSKIELCMRELEFFARISHTRFVPLLGHCLEHDSEKLLVYRYMPNADLASSLNRLVSPEDGTVQTLDWITRLKIAIGAAEGLSYLHERSPPIVHRDVQATSIFLDDKFEVRLGSLSDAYCQEGDSHQNALTRLVWKPQNSEQGTSGPQPMTCAYDVYCFGLVLLELITGKIGISTSDNATIRVWLEETLPCINIQDKESVTSIIDPSLIIDEDLLEEVWAMAIVAKSCLNPKPLRRPLMRYILKALEYPLKVVRVDKSNSGRLRTTSSRRSWSAAFFGSWRYSSSENAAILGGLRQLGRIGSHGSAANEFSSSQKRSSNEIFPETVETEDLEAK